MSPLPSLSALRLPLPPSLLLAPIKSGVAAGVRDAAGAVGRLVRPSERGVWSYPGRYYIEVRGVHGIGGEQVARRVERALEEHPRVRWARVNSPSERVVVAVGKPPPSEQDLIARIERAEVQEPVAPSEEFDEWAPEPHHPSGGGREAQSLAVVAADVVGLGVATALRLTPWLRLPTEVAATMAIIQNHPRLRRLALAITRGEPTEAALPVLAALTQGVATRGGGLALDLIQRMALWREAEAEGRAWAAMEPQLVHGPQDVVAEPIVVERPGPSPKDTVERFAERSMAVGAMAGVLTVPFAGPRRGFAVGFSSVPKAPGAG
ncbi:heavy-metal-associated domain-containing protein, partial [Streptomyces javensis]